MSLAPPAFHNSSQPRLSTVLPGLKCSTCAAQIPLGYLGDHVCAGPSSSSSKGGIKGYERPPGRRKASASQQSSSPRQQHSLLPSTTPSSLSSRLATPLKIDLGAVSNWGEAKRNHGGGGDAGMAGVGRRGFGMEYDGTPLLPLPITENTSEG